MATNKKVLLIVTAMLILLSLIEAINVSINFRDFGAKYTQEKAESIAEAVRDGLTSHMVNGTMDKRNLFLDNMMHNQDVEALRVVRSEAVIALFGEGQTVFEQYTPIEKQVLRSGKPYSVIDEDTSHAMLKMTIPYIASKYATPNCLQCHTNANEGDVLGVISMDIDIGQTRQDAIYVILRIISVNIFFLFIIIFVTNYVIRPYVKLFADLEDGITKAYHGDFSYHVKTELDEESGGTVATRLNELSDIFRFKRTIELDENKEIIYGRLVELLKSHFKVQSFVLIESNNFKREKHIVFESGVEMLPEGIRNEDPKTCRAIRTGNITMSSDFPNICEACASSQSGFICLPFSINDEFSLVLHIRTHTEKELDRVKGIIPIISNYFELAQPVIESKILMHILHESSLKDGLTGLYNRRFMDQFMGDVVNNDSAQFAAMLIDIDYFKSVNDEYGHDVGDKIIKGLSQLLLTNIKGSDYAIRYGGEEFLILLFDVNMDDALRIAQILRTKFESKKFKAGDELISKTLSVGIALYPEQGSTPWEIIKYADTALYKAKNSGRNQVVAYQGNLSEE